MVQCSSQMFLLSELWLGTYMLFMIYVHINSLKHTYNSIKPCIKHKSTSCIMHKTPNFSRLWSSVFGVSSHKILFFTCSLGLGWKLETVLIGWFVLFFIISVFQYFSLICYFSSFHLYQHRSMFNYLFCILCNFCIYVYFTYFLVLQKFTNFYKITFSRWITMDRNYLQSE